MAELQSRDSAIEAKADANAAAIAGLKQELAEKFARYDKAIAEMSGKVRVNAMAHFDFDSSDLRDADKAALDELANVVSNSHPGSLLTVEGFTDAAGGSGYNKRLGQARADAVRDYLVSAGLPADSVRAVSYGESSDRQVNAGAIKDDGMANRRAAVIFDRIGS
ncbi:MAG: OmpA family protein [Xanthomonadales bacterium]|nr:OmpA family protein [Xanthomonadales bacterium]